ncbi:MAG: C13 family peptidase [Arenimonas sp.]
MIERSRLNVLALFRYLGQALSLAFWRRPRSRLVPGGFGLYLASCCIALLGFTVQDYSGIDAPADFSFDAFHAHASYFLFVMIAAWLAARVLQRPALWLGLAILVVLIGIPWTAISLWTNDWFADADKSQLYAWRALLAMAGFVALFRAIGFVSSASPAPRRLLASLGFVLVLAAPWYWQQHVWFWYAPEATQAPEPPNAPTANKTAHRAPGFDPEAVLSSQPQLLQRAIDSVRAQTPGKIDLFTVGFAGDGGQKVFRNEVEYFGQLMSRRFDADGRTLSLINSVDTVDRVPLATLTNLRAALAGVAARMDTSEDVLVLFLTSHGSEDHQLLVDLDPLPLRQIQPRDLRAALDDAGIHWRVIVVSACYSGGFVDALRDPDTLVITAARADRTSFGCGNDSKITWFGRSFLAAALNQTTDFERGFDLASRQIREWELAQGETASVPQIAGGWAIRKHLAIWRASVPTAPPVPFLSR